LLFPTPEKPPIFCEFDSMVTCPAKAAPAKRTVAQRPIPGAARAKAAPAPVVTLKAVFEQLGAAHDLPKKQAHGLLADFVAAATTHLRKGVRVRMSGLGVLEVKKRAARMGRNPATGEAIRIKASKTVAFRAAKELKEAV
jgi:DNA-binding protein HU-beta